MKKLLSALFLGLFALPSLAHAVSVEVISKCGEKMPGAQGELTDYASNMTVFEATVKVVKQKGGVDIQTDHPETYVKSIGGVGEDREKSADGIRAWGWDVSLDGRDLSISPMLEEVSSPQSKIKWVYGYVLMSASDDGSCAKDDCSFHKGETGDCAKDKAEAPVAPEAPAVVEAPADPAAENAPEQK